jgi:hypothetical protein
MEAVIRAAMEVVIWAAMEAVIREAMEEAAETAMEAAEAAMERAAIEEGTGIQSGSGIERASEDVGIQDSHRIHDCLREAETSARRTCLRTCRQQRRTSRTALEVLFLASLRQSAKRQQKTIRNRRKKK